MNIRGLKTSDIFKMSKILKKMSLKIDTEGKTQEQVGAEIIMSAFENLYMAQDDVNEFMGDLVGLSAKEFNELPIENSVKIIQQFKNIPGITGFFKAAGVSMK